MKKTKKQLVSLIICLLIMTLGLILLKFIPMKIFGREILFDASMHITAAVFTLYVIWYFVDQNIKWKIPYLIFSALVITIVAINRILNNAHNDIGLLMGLILSCLAIITSRWDYFRGKLKF